jgi:hypothetical protein
MRRTSLLLFTLPMTLAAAPAAPPLSIPQQLPVEIHLLGPDGAPVANRDVTVTFLRAETVPAAALRTDAAGILRFDTGPGPTRFAIDVPGVGRGATGLVRIDPAGPAVTVPLPPLAPYSRITGALAPQLLQRPLSLEASATGNRGSKHLYFSPDPDGHFQLDVPAGTWTLTARDPQNNIPLATAGPFTTHADQTATIAIDHLVAPPAATGPGKPFPWRALNAAAPGQQNAWVEGALTDAAGHPLAGATVYVAATFPGGHRG